MGNDKGFVREITPRDTDFGQWYNDLVRKAELADYAPVRGCMVIRPYGFAIWELMRDALDRRIKATGHENAYFPLLIPESLLQREADHVAGFAPEVAWVTYGGSEKLEERLAIRPTSEAIIGEMYSKWIQSWRDLPLLINQWANVLRWEKVTRLFLRTTEFLWQEGHTCHATYEEAQEETLMILNDVYVDFAEKELAIPMYTGFKTDREKFPGALMTYPIEALMPDGRALQAGTSHNLGQNFSKMFNIRYEDQNNELQYVWQTSWGVTTRLVGALIMAHGDDRGLRLPPRVAPIQVVIVPIIFEKTREQVLARAAEIADTLKAAGVRVRLDDRDGYSPGWKYNEWEMRGVPLRLEFGPKDMEKEAAMMARRDTGEKTSVPLANLADTVIKTLDEIQANLLTQATEYRDTHTLETADRAEFLKLFEGRPGYVKAPICGDDACEDAVKADTGATIRFIKLEPEDATAEKCIHCGEPAKWWAYFAKAY